MVDFLIVGGGIAGVSFAEIAFLNNKSFIVINDDSQNSSVIAAGLYNPVILKRFSLPMDSHKHLDFIGPFYKRIEERLNVRFDFELPIYRRFASVEEQNNWFEAADKPALAPFLDTRIVHNTYKHLSSPHGFGKVLHTGYIDTAILLRAYHRFLMAGGALLADTFDYKSLNVQQDSVTYRNITAKHIVFAEGFGLHSNPLFNYLPLDGTKGELLIIKAPDLHLDVAVNAGVFILPLGNDLYKVGATYEWYDKTPLPTVAAKEELIAKLEEIVTCSYEIVSHLAGVRPTVKDRKSLIGTHPDYKTVHLLNGLGTRGVMLGPPMAKELYDSILSGVPVDKAVGLQRFRKS